MFTDFMFSLSFKAAAVIKTDLHGADAEGIEAIYERNYLSEMFVAYVKCNKNPCLDWREIDKSDNLKEKFDEFCTFQKQKIN